MKSPITGKEMSIQKEERTITFRKETFPVMYHYYFCADSGEQFTTTELDELNMQQVYNQYRDKHNLPFPEEIKRIREKYGLSAVKMSEVLGFGVNSYRNYENGEVPSNANGNLIQMVKDPEQFKYLVGISEAISGEAKEKLLRRIDTLINKDEQEYIKVELIDYFLDGNLPNEFTGYKKPDFDRLTEMVIFFSQHLKPWKTQMNKLLFYADFLAFKQSCFSISGARYCAINMGPVPNNYNSIYEYMQKKNAIDISANEFPNGGIGEQFKVLPDKKFNPELFNDFELEVLQAVAKKFNGMNTQKMIDLSHQEKAWIANQTERKMISYKYAFDLSGV